MKAKLKSLAIKLYRMVYSFKFKNNFKSKVNEIRDNKKNAIIFIATPVHGNLGDQAIIYAQKKFFDDKNLSDHVIEITTPEFEHYNKIIKNIISDNDIIIIDGGGNLGTLWMNEEDKIRKVIKNFPKNPIFIFPQTIFYSKDEFGLKQLEVSKEIYSAHSKLYICARETTSYNYMKDHFIENNILYVPDIVLYLNEELSVPKRDGVLLCFRDDKEKVFSEDLKADLIDTLKSGDKKIFYESTVIPLKITDKNRNEELFKKWSSFASAELVITDRLHGMIFAAITSTPCIAFDNSSKKVGNVYKWIENLGLVKFINYDNITEYTQVIRDSLDNPLHVSYNNEHLKSFFEQLYLEIDKYLNKE